MSGLESDRFHFDDEALAATTTQKPLNSSAQILGPAIEPESGTTFGQDADHDLNESMTSALLKVDAGKYRSAIAMIRSVLAQDPTHPEAVYWLGYCLSKTDEPEQALKCFRALAKINPSEDAFHALGTLYYEMGIDDLAKQNLKKALEEIDYESPLLFDIYKTLGNIFLKENDFDSAEENYNRAYAVYSNSDVLLVNFGTLEIQKGNMEAAAERFRQAIDVNKLNEKAWLGLALISKAKSDEELVWGHLLTALEANPGSATVLHFLVQWALETHSFDRAIEALQSYMVHNPEDEDMSYSLAGLLFEAHRIPECRIELERTLALNHRHMAGIELRNRLRKLGQ
jgi:tetratricopeptide (TPR) repeat protein